jgi:hypothetical protein
MTGPSALLHDTYYQQMMITQTLRVSKTRRV